MIITHQHAVGMHFLVGLQVALAGLPVIQHVVAECKIHMKLQREGNRSVWQALVAPEHWQHGCGKQHFPIPALCRYHM